MTFYSNIYYTLCESRKQEKINYKKGSNLHKHHIIPKHMGGIDEDSNLTYLTIKEHKIAHFLLWKINSNMNDLRSMKMLGVNLSYHYRHILGKWCYKNKIGFFSDKFTTETKNSWRMRGVQNQIDRKIGIHDPIYSKIYASIGGKASIITPNNPWCYWASPEGMKERSSLGGKSHKGKKTMYLPGDLTFIRVPQEKINEYKNNGYILGSPIPSPTKGKKTNRVSPRRKKVTDGKIIYNSLHEAAEKNNITPSAIVYRCKSKKSTWQYVS